MKSNRVFEVFKEVRFVEEVKKQLEEFKNSLKDIENHKYKNYFSTMTNIVDKLSDIVEGVMVNLESLEENIGFMDKDLSNIQDELFEEVSIEDLDNMDNEYEEIKCVHCQKPIFIEQSALKNGTKIPCPYCHKNII